MFVVTAPVIDYNDQTYDVYPSSTVIYAGPDEGRAKQIRDTSAQRLAANWNFDDFADSVRNGHSSALEVIRSKHVFFSQPLVREGGTLMAVFGPTAPVEDGWGGATSYGVECWAVTTQQSVLDVVAGKRDQYIKAYVRLCPDDSDAVESAIEDLLHAVRAVEIDPEGYQCEG